MMLAPWKKIYDKPRQCIKSRDITLLTKVHIVKAVVTAVILESKKIKSVTTYIFPPTICSEVMEPDAMIFPF